MIGMYVDIEARMESIWKKIICEAYMGMEFPWGPKNQNTLGASSELISSSLIQHVINKLPLHRNCHRPCTSHHSGCGQRSRPTDSTGLHHDDPHVETRDTDIVYNISTHAIRKCSSVGRHQRTQAYTVGGRIRRVDENDE